MPTVDAEMCSLRRACTSCTKCENATRSLGVCSKCRVSRYCDAACQSNDWPRHRKVCGELTATLVNNLRNCALPMGAVHASMLRGHAQVADGMRGALRRIRRLGGRASKPAVAAAAAGPWPGAQVLRVLNEIGCAIRITVVGGVTVDGDGDLSVRTAEYAKSSVSRACDAILASRGGLAVRAKQAFDDHGVAGGDLGAGLIESVSIDPTTQVYLHLVEWTRRDVIRSRMVLFEIVIDYWRGEIAVARLVHVA